MVLLIKKKLITLGKSKLDYLPVIGSSSDDSSLCSQIEFLDKVNARLTQAGSFIKNSNGQDWQTLAAVLPKMSITPVSSASPRSGINWGPDVAKWNFLIRLLMGRIGRHWQLAVLSCRPTAKNVNHAGQLSESSLRSAQV